MAQLTIYLDDKTLRKIEKAAKESKSSVSLWVRQRLERTLATDWPAGYEELFGSIGQEDLYEPEELSFKKDIPRGTV